MLKHFKLGAKLALGYSALILLTVILGTISIRKMHEVSVSANQLTNDAVPTVKAANDIERNALMMMYYFRSYFNTGNEENLVRGMEFLNLEKETLQKAQQLGEKNKNEKLLTSVKAGLSLINDYLQVVNVSKELMQQNKVQVEKFGDQAEALRLSCVEYMEGQQKVVFTSLEDSAATSASSKMSDHVWRMEATDEIISDCEHVRGAFYKAIIFKQNAEIEESLKVFPEIDKDIRAIKEKSAADQQGDLLKMQQHAQDVEALLKQTVATLKELAELAPKRLAMLDRIAENAKTLATGGIEATEKVAATSSEKLDASSRVMLGGLVAVVLLGTLLAIVMTLNILRPVKEIVARIKDIAQGEGDLTLRVHLSSNDEIGELASWFNKFIERVHGIISEVAAATREVSSAATQIAASSEEMSTGMREQSSQTQQVSSAVEEMSSTVIEVAQKSAEAANNAETAGRQAGTGGEVVHRTIAGIQEIEKVVSSSAEVITELGERGEQIGAIIGVINDIADQTNLLALNAAIEAARAGEHGRGFAVVADEVRKLAERTTHATKEVAESIIAIQHETKDAVQRISAGTVRVSEGVELAREAGTALQMIVASASGVSGMIQSIAAASEQQSAAAEQIARNIESINAITRQSSDGVAQAAAAAMQLSAKSEQLQHLVGQFKI